MTQVLVALVTLDSWVKAAMKLTIVIIRHALTEARVKTIEMIIFAIAKMGITGQTANW
jgi:hypothetical protein